MKTKRDPLSLENQLCFKLYLASKTFIQLYQPFLKTLDLTYLQYIVLLTLWEHDHLSMKDLGQKLHLDSGTLSPLLKKLLAKGLIARERDPEDERVILLSLTAEGRGLKKKALCLPTQILEKSGLGLKKARELFVALNLFQPKTVAPDEIE